MGLLGAGHWGTGQTRPGGESLLSRWGPRRTEEDLQNNVRIHPRRRHRSEVKGDEEVEYDGEKNTFAANLYDVLKEGAYGKF
jgi:hypothetical protein